MHQNIYKSALCSAFFFFNKIEKLIYYTTLNIYKALCWDDNKNEILKQNFFRFYSLKKFQYCHQSNIFFGIIVKKINQRAVVLETYVI